MRRRRPGWNRTTGPRAPWTSDEDAQLCDMVRCGLASEYYREHLPGRSFGDILARRLELIEAGQLQRAKAI